MTLRMSESRNLMLLFHIFLLASKEGRLSKRKFKLLLNWSRSTTERSAGTTQQFAAVNLLIFYSFLYYPTEIAKIKPRQEARIKYLRI